MDRRDFVKTLVMAAAGPLAGCATAQEPIPISGTLIDAHCHVFNASDLPAARFIRRVFLEDYPEQAAIRTLDIRNPDTLDRLIELLLRILGANEAPTALAEIEVLDGRTDARSESADFELASKVAIDATARFMMDLQARLGPRALSGAIPRNGNAELLNALTSAGGTGERRIQSFGVADARATAARAFASPADIGVYLRWFTMFTLYRHSLVDRLVADTERQGFQPILLTPATIDFDKWLGESVRSPIADQAAVMARISRRTSGPPVHGYFGFDPLREVYFEHGLEPVSPLAMARTALTEHGFLGIKLYPPMGFRPSQNAAPYPKMVRKDLGKDPSAELDRVLESLYLLCVELDAPILAHAYGSNGAGPEYSKRADPAYWLPVFARHPELRVCLAHFGRFDLVSEATPSTRLPEGSWEWALGRHFRANPVSPVFADMSYFSEVLHVQGEARRTLAETFQRYIHEFDPEITRLVFGSDWIMLGLERDYPKYVSAVDTFLKDDCGLSDSARTRFFSQNALRLLGLRRGDRARDRLLKFYARNGLEPARLPAAGSSIFGTIR